MPLTNDQVTSTQEGSTDVQIATATAYVTSITSLPIETTTLTVTSTESGSPLTETQTATTTQVTISDNFSTDITTAPAETSFITSIQISEITITAFSTFTESASCDIPSSTESEPPIYDGPTTTTTQSIITITAFSTITESASCEISSSTEGRPSEYAGPTTTTTTSSTSTCATPNAQFLLQLDGTNLYLTGQNGGAAPEGNSDQTLVTTSDEANAISFSAAVDGNGQATLVSDDGTTLYSDQDSILGSGDGPIYWDSAEIYGNGDYYPVQFCLQQDDTFIVQNLLGTADTADDANIIQICPDGVLYLYDARRAAASNCNTVSLRMRTVQVNPSYPDPASSTSESASSTSESASSTSESASSTSTTSTTGPSVSACVPVPDGQEFRISLVGSLDYLTGADGGLAPTANDGQALVTTTDYSQAIPFKSAEGRDGQITLISADGTTLYSDQDIGAPGDEPIYFDDFDSTLDSGMYPVQFCLQSDNTFVVQNQMDDKTDASDDANIVQLCPTDGNKLYLRTASNAAASSDCNAVRLQIATAPPPPPPPPPPPFDRNCPASSIAIPENQEYRVRSGRYGTWLKLKNDWYPTEGTLVTVSDINDATLFTALDSKPAQLRTQVADDLLYSILIPYSEYSGGPYFYRESENYQNVQGWGPLRFCRQNDDSLTIRANNVDVDQAVVCRIRNPYFIRNGDSYFVDDGDECYMDSLYYEPIVPPPVVTPFSCPDTIVAIPEGQQFRVQVRDQPGRWLSGDNGDSTPQSGDIRTTRNIADAVLFTATPGGTGQISLQVNGQPLDSQMYVYLGDNTGIAYWSSAQDASISGFVALQFCRQGDDSFVVHSDGLDGPGPGDVNAAILCTNINGPVYIGNDAMIDPNLTAAGCSPATLMYDPVGPPPPAYDPPTGCPATTIPIAEGQQFRVQSRNTPGLYITTRGGYQSTTTTRDDATLFTVTLGGTGQISTVQNGQSVDSQFVSFYNNANGYLSMYQNADVQDRGWYPLQFCRQSDDSFVVYSVGGDGVAGPGDTNTALICPNPSDMVYFDNDANIPSDFFEIGCRTDTLMYDPYIPPPPPYVPPTGCPATTVAIPENQLFRVRSSNQANVYLFAGNPPNGGLIKTTTTLSDATLFKETSGGTGQISFDTPGGQTYNTFFDVLYNSNSGYIFSAAAGTAPNAVQFCLQPDNTFAVYSPGSDGPGANDATFVTTCEDRTRLVYIDNGSASEYYPVDCDRDTLIYEPVN